MKLLVASFAAVAMFVGFAVTSNACGKDGKCVGKSSTSCCASKSKCATKSSCSTKSSAAKGAKSDDKSATATVAPASTPATTAVSATGK